MIDSRSPLSCKLNCVDEEILAQRGWSRQTKIRRDDQGCWFDDDERVTHPGVAAAFDRWLDVLPDGRFCLRNRIHWVYVEVEGPPIFIRSLRFDDGGVLLRLSGDAEERLDPRTVFQGVEGALFARVREGKMLARFDRAATMVLSAAIDEDDGRFFLNLGGQRYEIPLPPGSPQG